jgi:hypothetical protein
MNQGRNNGACFNCGQQGHFAHNCLQKWRNDQNYSNLIDFDNNEVTAPYTTPYEEPMGQDCISFMKEQLNNMSLEDKGRLAEEMGASEDFQLA